MIEYLTLEHVPALIDDLQVGPIRDVGLLDSAVHRSQATGVRCARISRDRPKGSRPARVPCAQSRPDRGNERIGWLAPVVFYGLNDIKLESSDDDAYDLVIAIACSAVAYEEAVQHLARWHWLTSEECHCCNARRALGTRCDRRSVGQCSSILSLVLVLRLPSSKWRSRTRLMAAMVPYPLTERAFGRGMAPVGLGENGENHTCFRVNGPAEVIQIRLLRHSEYIMGTH